MKWENFTAERVAGYQCKQGKSQSIFWDGKTPGLGMRVTAANAKSYIFQTDIQGKTVRITIGDPRTWKIGEAQSEATRLKAMTDQGIDPRQVKADFEAAKIEKSVALKLKESRESLTLGAAWTEYLKNRKPYWGERHYKDHEDVIHAGGEIRKRSKKLTEPGVLASLASVRLVDLNAERITAWAKIEGEKRSGRARLASRLLKAFLTWCTDHPDYKLIVTTNSAKNKSTRESLGKPKTLDDVLQREQLSAWFAAVQKIGNPVISAYLQILLLIGSRPNELAMVKWDDVDFKWGKLTIRDKVEGERVIPLTPYVAYLMESLSRCNLTMGQVGYEMEKEIQNPYVFVSPTAEYGFLVDPHDAFKKACAVAEIDLTIYGLRRSFATLSEWVEAPSGIAAQIQGHKPSGVREKHYIRRPIDLLRMWHIKIETWILEQAQIKFGRSKIENGRVFISHGRIPIWPEVQDCIEKDVGLKTLELAQISDRDGVAIEKLWEESGKCDSAIIVMTNDNLDTENLARARENVIHEIGFFQGKYGFGRVVLLHEDGLNIPTNIKGVVYTSFPKGMVSASLGSLVNELKVMYQ